MYDIYIFLSCWEGGGGGGGGRGRSSQYMLYLTHTRKYLSGVNYHQFRH